MELSDIPLFNESGLTKLIPEVGPKGIYYLELRPKHKLKQFVVDPDDVVVDIYIGPKDTLIYSFYNPTRRKSIAITAAIEKDDEGVYLKIKANPADIRWRQYFINSISSKYQALDTQTYNFTVRELMTQDQLADYLQVSKKTIQNWTSTGKLKGEWISGTKEVRYRKSTIDDLLKSDSIKSGYHKLKSCHRCFHYLTYLLSLPQQ